MRLTAEQQQFEQLLNLNKASQSAWLNAFQQSSLKHFLTQGLPHRRVEHWKYTSVRALSELELDLPVDKTGPTITPINNGAYQLVFINGQLDVTQSDWDDLKKAISILSFSESDSAWLRTHLGCDIQTTAHPFAHLNSALFLSGLHITIPEHLKLTKPIHCYFYSTAQAKTQIIQPRLFIQAGANSHSEFVFHYSSDTDAQNFVNTVTEFHLEQSARVDYYLIQDEGLNHFHINGSHASLKQGAEFKALTIALGGKLVRNDLNVYFKEANATCHMNGLYLGQTGQHIDNHTYAEHAASDCISREFYKGVIAGHSRAVFNGRVKVAKDTQRTQAEQNNRNLVLAENAEINTKPELEIYSDDVACSHGATVGQLDEDSIFYLRARGINEKQAKHMLMHGFVEEILKELPAGELKAYLQQRVNIKLTAMNLENSHD